MKTMKLLNGLCVAVLGLASVGCVSKKSASSNTGSGSELNIFIDVDELNRQAEVASDHNFQRYKVFAKTAHYKSFEFLGGKAYSENDAYFYLSRVLDKHSYFSEQRESGEVGALNSMMSNNHSDALSGKSEQVGPRRLVVCQGEGSYGKVEEIVLEITNRYDSRKNPNSYEAHVFLAYTDGSTSIHGEEPIQYYEEEIKGAKYVKPSLNHTELAKWFSSAQAEYIKQNLMNIEFDTQGLKFEFDTMANILTLTQPNSDPKKAPRVEILGCRTAYLSAAN